MKRREAPPQGPRQQHPLAADDSASGGRRVNPLELLRNAIARIVSARESLDYGDTDEAAAVLHDLEVDLAGALSIYTEREAA